MMKKKLVLPLVAAAALMGLAGAASAEPAKVTSSVNVRSGPGTSYSIVAKAKAGEIVDVKGCQSGWCYIEKSGPDGWVSGRYLTRAPGGPVINFLLNFGNPPKPSAPSAPAAQPAPKAPAAQTPATPNAPAPGTPSAPQPKP